MVRKRHLYSGRDMGVEGGHAMGHIIVTQHDMACCICALYLLFVFVV